jgi:hypothetical protein
MPSGLTLEAAVFAAAAAIDGRDVDTVCDPAVVVERAIVHRVSALLAHSGWSRTLPPAEAATLDEDARLGALHAAVLDRELEHLLSRLDDRGVTPLVTKGAHLAHAVYSSPALRPRADTDLLIDPASRVTTTEILTAHGYSRSARTSGALILGQFEFERRLQSDVTHYVDVHWRPVAPLIFEGAFDLRELGVSAAAIPALGPHARGPSVPDALALACVHLVAHHWHQILLVWLYDIRLLADAIDEHGRRQLVDGAIAGSYTVVLNAALRTARLYFEGAGLDHAIAAVAPHVNEGEAASALTRDGRRKVDDLWLDLRHAPWRQRAQLLREHVLPPSEYMRARFGGPVPLAYAKRVLFGVRKWF